MVAFWILATLMTGVALAFVLVPLLRARESAAPSPSAATLDALRDSAARSRPTSQPACCRRFARGGAGRTRGSRRDRAPRRWRCTDRASTPRLALAAGLAVAIPALAIGIYLWLGNPSGLDPACARRPDGRRRSGRRPRRAGRGRNPALNDKQILAMVETLAAKVKERPDDVKGWSLLARSMNALGRYAEAVDAYEHLTKLVPDSADVLADYADSLAMKQGRNLSGKPYALVKRALKIDPGTRRRWRSRHRRHERGRLRGLDPILATLGAQVEPGSEDAAKVDGIIAEVRERAAARASRSPWVRLQHVAPLRLRPRLRSPASRRHRRSSRHSTAGRRRAHRLGHRRHRRRARAEGRHHRHAVHLRALRRRTARPAGRLPRRSPGATQGRSCSTTR
jgi:cytochrome c-type biogenesis protein CcmH